MKRDCVIIHFYDEFVLSKSKNLYFVIGFGIAHSFSLIFISSSLSQRHFFGVSEPVFREYHRSHRTHPYQIMPSVAAKATALPTANQNRRSPKPSAFHELTERMGVLQTKLFQTPPTGSTPVAANTKIPEKGKLSTKF